MADVLVKQKIEKSKIVSRGEMNILFSLENEQVDLLAVISHKSKFNCFF